MRDTHWDPSPHQVPTFRGRFKIQGCSGHAMQTEQQRHSNPNNTHNQASDKVLFGDHFVILTKDIFCDKCFFVMMCVCSHSDSFY